MTGWLARAAAFFAESPPTPTDKTDKTPLSSVSSVAPWGVSAKAHGVSSVSSVGVPPLWADFDDRVTCTACRHYLAAVHLCRNHRAAALQSKDIAPALAVLPQWCHGWKGWT